MPVNNPFTGKRTDASGNVSKMSAQERISAAKSLGGDAVDRVSSNIRRDAQSNISKGRGTQEDVNALALTTDSGVSSRAIYDDQGNVRQQITALKDQVYVYSPDKGTLNQYRTSSGNIIRADQVGGIENLKSYHDQQVEKQQSSVMGNIEKRSKPLSDPKNLPQNQQSQQSRGFFQPEMSSAPVNPTASGISRASQKLKESAASFPTGSQFNQQSSYVGMSSKATPTGPIPPPSPVAGSVEPSMSLIDRGRTLLSNWNQRASQAIFGQYGISGRMDERKDFLAAEGAYLKDQLINEKNPIIKGQLILQVLKNKQQAASTKLISGFTERVVSEPVSFAAKTGIGFAGGKLVQVGAEALAGTPILLKTGQALLAGGAIFGTGMQIIDVASQPAGTRLERVGYHLADETAFGIGAGLSTVKGSNSYPEGKKYILNDIDYQRALKTDRYGNEYFGFDPVQAEGQYNLLGKVNKPEALQTSSGKLTNFVETKYSGQKYSDINIKPRTLVSGPEGDIKITGLKVQGLGDAKSLSLVTDEYGTIIGVKPAGKNVLDEAGNIIGSRTTGGTRQATLPTEDMIFYNKKTGGFKAANLNDVDYEFSPVLQSNKQNVAEFLDKFSAKTEIYDFTNTNPSKNIEFDKSLLNTVARGKKVQEISAKPIQKKLIPDVLDIKEVSPKDNGALERLSAKLDNINRQAAAYKSPEVETLKSNEFEVQTGKKQRSSLISKKADLDYIPQSEFRGQVVDVESQVEYLPRQRTALPDASLKSSPRVVPTSETLIKLNVPSLIAAGASLGLTKLYSPELKQKSYSPKLLLDSQVETVLGTSQSSEVVNLIEKVTGVEPIVSPVISIDTLIKVDQKLVTPTRTDSSFERLSEIIPITAGSFIPELPSTPSPIDPDKFPTPKGGMGRFGPDYNVYKPKRAVREWTINNKVLDLTKSFSRGNERLNAAIFNPQIKTTRYENTKIFSGGRMPIFAPQGAPKRSQSFGGRSFNVQKSISKMSKISKKKWWL